MRLARAAKKDIPEAEPVCFPAGKVQHFARQNKADFHEGVLVHMVVIGFGRHLFPGIPDFSMMVPAKSKHYMLPHIPPSSRCFLIYIPHTPNPVNRRPYDPKNRLTSVTGDLIYNNIIFTSTLKTFINNVILRALLAVYNCML
jgi:hypothetical protein